MIKSIDKLLKRKQCDQINTQVMNILTVKIYIDFNLKTTTFYCSIEYTMAAQCP